MVVMTDLFLWLGCQINFLIRWLFMPWPFHWNTCDACEGAVCSQLCHNLITVFFVRPHDTENHVIKLGSDQKKFGPSSKIICIYTCIYIHSGSWNHIITSHKHNCMCGYIVWHYLLQFLKWCLLHFKQHVSAYLQWPSSGSCIRGCCKYNIIVIRATRDLVSCAHRCYSS
jgi:hypothetical protein